MALAAFVAAIVTLLAFWLVSTQRRPPSSRFVASLNLAGSILFTFVHVAAGIWGSVALDVTWGVVALCVLVKRK